MYYNDNDKHSCHWGKCLMNAGLVPEGVIDDRDIRDIAPSDLSGFTECHFFAGIFGWPYALRLASWPRGREIWTGSCPCQPFSSAGKGRGIEDERHLWPAFRKLIATCFPATIFGEQVSSSDGREWLEAVRFDCEHIIYWHAFEKTMHAVREAKTHEVLSQILGQIAGRVETVVHLLSEEIRGRGAEKEQAAAVKGERAAIRFGRIRKRIEQSFESWNVRTDGTAVKAGTWSKGVEQPEPGQNQRESWLHIRQCANGLFRNECGTGQLGGRGASADSYRLVGKDDVDDERTIAERFRTVIANSVARLRNAGILDEVDELGYAFGAADLPACCVGAPHVRQRLFWVADTECTKRERPGNTRSERSGFADAGWMEQSNGPGWDPGGLATTAPRHRSAAEPASGAGRVVNAESGGTAPAQQSRRIQGVKRAGKDSFWGLADYVYCTDGKWRPVEPSHVMLVDGVSGTMVGSVHSTISGGVEGAGQAAVLEKQPKASGETSPASMRSVRAVRYSTVGSSSGPEPSEQQPRQLDDVVRLMPQSYALAQLHGRRQDEKELLVLLHAISEEANVQYPFEQVEAAWTSLSEKAKNRLRMDFDAARWRIVVPFPLARKIPKRAVQLRGLGNAIVPQLAAVFIKCVMMGESKG